MAKWRAAGLWAPVDAWPWGDMTSKGPSRLCERGVGQGGGWDNYARGTRLWSKVQMIIT